MLLAAPFKWNTTMPGKAPRICPCGHTIQARQKCPCQKRGDAERKARHDRNRKTSSQRGYNGTWDRERVTYLGSHPHCRFCGKTACVVDHIKPHKGTLENLRQKLLQMGAEKLFDALWPEQTGGASGTSGIFGAIFGGLGIPGFASGTNSAPGGLAIVGERGPELVNLSRGAQVFTASDTKRILSGQNARSLAPVGGTGKSSLNVTIHNAPEGDHRVTQNGNDLDIYIEQRVLDTIAGPKGKKVMNANYGVRPKAWGA